LDLRYFTVQVFQTLRLEALIDKRDVNHHHLRRFHLDLHSGLAQPHPLQEEETSLEILMTIMEDLEGPRIVYLQIDPATIGEQIGTRLIHPKLRYQHFRSRVLIPSFAWILYQPGEEILTNWEDGF
jgi:hypothetical protein